MHTSCRTTATCRGGGGTTTDCFLLNLDADLSEWTNASIGTREVAFGGHFDGQGHTLTYPVTGDANQSGLFPYVKDGAVKNLNVIVSAVSKKDTVLGALVSRAENSVIDGVSASITLTKSAAHTAETPDGWFGGIAGSVDAASIVRNASVRATATEYTYFGGIAAQNYGAIEKCEFLMLPSTNTIGMYGGIAAENIGGTITDCKASMSPDAVVTQTILSGGIVANFAGGSVTGCLSEMNVAAHTADSVLLGGIAGAVNRGIAGVAAAENSTVENCKVIGVQMNSGAYSGGLIGVVNADYAVSAVRIADSSVELPSIGTPAVRTKQCVGGLIGEVIPIGSVTVTNCTSESDIYAFEAWYIGGLVGNVYYTQSNASFTMTDSHCYAGLIDGTAEGRVEDFGGAIGAIGDNGTALTGVFFRAVGCSAYASVNCTVGPDTDHVGGFVGLCSSNALTGALPEFENCAAYGNLTGGTANGGAYGGFCGYVCAINYDFVQCVSNGVLTSIETGNGGFIGLIASVGNTFTDCVSHTKLVTAQSIQGGFLSRDCGGNSFVRCKAYGDVSGTFAVGGFVADNITTKDRPSVFEDCEAHGNVTGSYHTGGFLGDVWEVSATYTGCKAFGDVTASYRAGGFLGMGNLVEGQAASFTDCAAYGNVYHADLTQDCFMGGFAGILYGAGEARFTGCSASGDVYGDASGGFIARVEIATLNVSRCVAYGNVYANDPGIDADAAGFIGWLSNPAGTCTLSYCDSYGDVIADTQNAGSNASGFLGAVTMIMRVDHCNSYAKRIVSLPQYQSGFILLWGTTDAKFTNCTYNKATGLGFYQSGNNSGSTLNTLTLPAAGTCENSGAPAGGYKKPLLTAAVSAAGTAVQAELSGFTNITGNITELAVSLDGGKFYTYLVYNGVTLTAVTDAVTGTTIPAGSTLAVSAATRYRFVYPASAYPSGNIVIRVVFSDGFSKVIRA